MQRINSAHCDASRRLGCKTSVGRNSDTKKSSSSYCPSTIDSHSSLGAREQVSEEPLGVVRLRRGLTQTVDEDGGAAVRFQHGADESLEKDEELLVLGRNAHLQGEGKKESVRLACVSGLASLCLE